MDLRQVCVLRLFVGIVLLMSFSYAQNFPQQPPQSNVPPNTQFNQPMGPQFNQPGAPTNQNFQPGGAPTNQNFQPTGTNQNFQPAAVPNQNPPQQPAIQPSSRPLSPEQQSQVTCAQAGRAAVSQCFQQNGGFQMMTVIALLSNGTQGQLPPNSEQVKQSLCQAHTRIVACVFSSITRFNGTDQCNTLAAFIRLEQETAGLLNGVQQMCGKGLMPKVTPCMQRLNYDMMKCYEEAGLNADLFSPRGSRMEGAIIGDNREVARMFCSKKGALYSCQNRVLKECPGARRLQELSGNDQKSMQSGTNVLCKDVDVYVKGLVCFQSPTKKVEDCAASLIQQMTEVTMKQIRDNLDKDAFFREYCRVRIENLKCDSEAWSDSCERVAVGLKTEYQCNLLPEQCKTDPEISDLYRSACAENLFARGLRVTGSDSSGSDPDSGASSVYFGLSSIILTVFASIVTFL
ncbi:hypothetical protein ACF0H5_019108 [Mactra antiquata]